MISVKEIKDKLVHEVAKLTVVYGIGQTSNDDKVLVPGQSDIDMFVLCTNIPQVNVRKQAYSKYSKYYSQCNMRVCDGGVWGHGDILVVNDIDIMFMYFTIEEMEAYIKDTLQGRFLERQGRFYPVGRLSSVANLNILYEKDEMWSRIKNMVTSPSNELFVRLFLHHSRLVIDSEDIGRVLLKKDVLFYHQVLEESIDHFLQALFALNKTYFPGRKHNKGYITSFKQKPLDCYNRLSAVIENASSAVNIEKSVTELKALSSELYELGCELKI